MNEALWAKRGYLRVHYEGEPAKKPRRIDTSVFDSVLSEVALYIASSLQGRRRRAA